MCWQKFLSIALPIYGSHRLTTDKIAVVLSNSTSLIFRNLKHMYLTSMEPLSWTQLSKETTSSTPIIVAHYNFITCRHGIWMQLLVFFGGQRVTCTYFPFCAKFHPHHLNPPNSWQIIVSSLEDWSWGVVLAWSPFIVFLGNFDYWRNQSWLRKFLK